LLGKYTQKVEEEGKDALEVGEEAQEENEEGPEETSRRALI
jgi:hypothetical protein